MKYEKVEDVRVGKYLEVVFDVTNDQEAHELVAKMCDQLLTNPVIEKYTYELVEVLA
jgi:phosphoribosylformylglycinamidine synthase